MLRLYRYWMSNPYLVAEIWSCAWMAGLMAQHAMTGKSKEGKE